jgi:hypothetical protein
MRTISSRPLLTGCPERPSLGDFTRGSYRPRPSLGERHLAIYYMFTRGRERAFSCHPLSQDSRWSGGKPEDLPANVCGFQFFFCWFLDEFPVLPGQSSAWVCQGEYAHFLATVAEVRAALSPLSCLQITNISKSTAMSCSHDFFSTLLTPYNIYMADAGKSSRPAIQT